MVFPKYIIEDGAIIISKVAYHREMVVDKTKVRGGGLFLLNREDKTLKLSGESYDFGRATLENVKECVENKKVYRNQYSEDDISQKYKISYESESGEITELN